MADRLHDGTAQQGELAGGAQRAGRLSAALAARKRDRRSDLTVAALGITLWLICALFPWYIFFNPDEFGVRAMRLGAGGNGTMPIVLGAQPGRAGAPAPDVDGPPAELDLIATGTAVKEHEEPVDEGAEAMAEQPFPPPVISFRVVQIANGRAMMEDDTGLFVVQPGSILPDSTRVETIGERDGKPVLVTDAGVVLEISQ
ncbi:MAG: hypothetical protein NTV73_02550 [Hyphomicrobiales bacterium]|nr:hypothetical protein [Hyphomicrobiales bacterium]